MVAASNVQNQTVLAAGAPLVFTLAAPLPAAAGQITLLINGNDVGEFLRTGDAMRYVLAPEVFPLPSGPLALALWFEPVSGGEPVLLFAAEVVAQPSPVAGARLIDPRLPLDASSLLGGSAGDTDMAQPGGGQVGSEAPAAGWVPKGTLSSNAVQTSRRGDQRSTRVNSELSAQMGLRYESAPGDAATGPASASRLALGANFVGNSQQGKAVRFASRGEQASKFDLNDYLLEYQNPQGRLSLGNASVAGNPLLGQSFDYRGLSGAYRFNSFVDIAATSQSSTALLGADPALGFTRVERRLTAMTVGLELQPEAPGTLRLELTGLTGRIQQAAPPAAPQATEIDAPAPGNGAAALQERSHGVALRVLWAPTDSRWRLDSGFARSTSTQPNPFGGEQLGGGRNAYYLEGTAPLLDSPADASRPARLLQLRLRHEFADTGFRSIAGGAAGDVRRTTVGAEGQYNTLQAKLQRSVARNNVAGFSNLPVTETITDTVNLTLPLARRDPLQMASAAASPAVATPMPDGASAPPRNEIQLDWWPTLTAGWQYNEQKPIRLPITLDAGTVPALTTGHATLGAQWVRGPWTWSGGLTWGKRDNRQAGFELQDQRSRGLQAQVQWQATPQLQGSLGVRRNTTRATDTGVTQAQTGADFNLSWQVDRWVINGQFSRNADRDSLATLDNRGRLWMLQISREWLLPLGLGQPVPLQVALRAQQQADNSQTVQDGTINRTDQRTRTIGLQVSVTF